MMKEIILIIAALLIYDVIKAFVFAVLDVKEKNKPKERHSKFQERIQKEMNK